jgi:hypothetical protein
LRCLKLATSSIEKGGMANRNPWKARLKRWEKLWPVPMAELQAQAFAVLQVAYEGVADDNPELRRKAILCYFQGLSAFTKLHEAVELERRVSTLEARLQMAEEVSHNGRH